MAKTSLAPLPKKKQDSPTVTFSFAVLADYFAMLERHDLRVDEIVINPITYKLFSRVFAFIRCGNPRASVWGAKVVQKDTAPVKHVIIRSSKAERFQGYTFDWTLENSPQNPVRSSVKGFK